jgi:hypothetical protein
VSPTLHPGLTGNQSVRGAIMPGSRDLRSLIDEYTQDPRLFAVQTDVGGDPPRLEEVEGSYRQVWFDLNWAWQLSEVYYVVTQEQENMSLDVSVRLEWRNNLDLSKGYIPDNNPFRGISWSDSHYPEPIARVLHASYSNPLETIIAVSAASIVMVIVSSIWAICKWKRSQNEADMVEAIANMTDKLATTLSNGDPKQIKAVEPIVKGIIQYGITYSNSQTKVDLQVPGGFKIAGA